MGRNLRRVLLWLLALAVFLVISVTPLWRGGQGLVQPWLRSLLQISHATGTWFSQVWRLSSLRHENEALRHQVAELITRQSTSEAVYGENDALRRLLALPAPIGYDRLAVEVIGQQIDETGVSYLINRGRRDGLARGLAAVAGVAGAPLATAGLVLVGTITDVGEQVASLTLTTASASEVLAMLAPAQTAQTLAVGEYNLAVRLKFLEIDQPVAVGEAVITSNLNTLMPPGLLIGTVITVEKSAGELFQSAVVAPPTPLEQFRFLYVLKPITTP